MHHQRPIDYTIEHQQHHNGTKNIDIIVVLYLKHFSCTAQTKNKQIMSLQRQLNHSAFFLHLFQITSNILTLPCNILCGRQETRQGMPPRWLFSHLVISSKWLPKIFIQIFKEYVKAKLQAPVARLTHLIVVLIACRTHLAQFEWKRASLGFLHTEIAFTFAGRWKLRK